MVVLACCSRSWRRPSIGDHSSRTTLYRVIRIRTSRRSRLGDTFDPKEHVDRTQEIRRSFEASWYSQSYSCSRHRNLRIRASSPDRHEERFVHCRIRSRIAFANSSLQIVRRLGVSKAERVAHPIGTLVVGLLIEVRTLARRDGVAARARSYARPALIVAVSMRDNIFYHA